MDNITELNAQKNIDSETMQKIREHANLYDSAYDKKEFLKNVSEWLEELKLYKDKEVQHDKS